MKYEIGQVVRLRDGRVGEVISICSYGNKDIRPPYNKRGIPQVRGINFLGFIEIIPNDWKKIYEGEVQEKEVI